MSIRLTPLQRGVVDHDEGPLLVVAGPGSGKTRVLTERIRRLLAVQEQHFRILALTFTNKAANEMSERLEEVPEVRERTFIGTLHSFCTEVLANRGKAVGINGLPTIFEAYQDRKQVLLEASAEDPLLWGELQRCSDQRAQSKMLDNWLEIIGTAKNSLQLPEMIDDDIVRRVYDVYNAGLRASSAVDFDDLLLLTYRLFEGCPKIADFYRRQYRYICVDEAQDLNEAQYNVLRALCGDSYNNIMLVGDPKQAIFVWNGANPKYLDQFVNDFGAEKLELNENFRCAKSVVRAAQALDASYKVEGQPVMEGAVCIKSLKDEEAEASFVMETIKELQNNSHPDIEGPITLGHCAVLGRNRFVFSSLEDKLKAEQWSYYKKLSAAAVESVSDLVEEFELALRILANPTDRLHVGLLAKRWQLKRPISEVTMDIYSSSARGFDVLNRLSESATSAYHQVVLSAVEALRWTPEDFHLFNALDYLDDYAVSLPEEEHARIVQDTTEWRKHWDYYIRSEIGGFHSMSSFLSQVALGTTQQPRQEGLALLTVHSAKGMEFDIVFVIGMAEGIFPDYRAMNSGLDEEVRNAYVAVTRSRRLLYLTYPCWKRMPWGDVKKQDPSRYLYDIHKTRNR